MKSNCVRKSLRRAPFSATALMMLAVASPAKAVDWMRSTGPIPGATYNIFTSISGDGKVVLGRSNTAGWVWSNGTYTFPVGFGGFAVPTAVSFDGSVIVGTAEVGGSIVHGVMWTAASAVPTDLHFGAAFDPGGTLHGYVNSRAFGISNDGAVVTGHATNASSTNQAFVWTQAAGMVGIGTLPGYAQSYGEAVSGDGQVVIGRATVGPTTQAFRWTEANGMTGLGFISGGTNSAATDVNHDGSVIVGYGNSSRASNEAFRWTQATGAVGLGFLSGYNQSTANAVSADGSIVVGYSWRTGSSQAFRWTAAGGMRSLESLLTDAHVDLGGWQLLYAQGISADGRIIAGRGINPQTGTDDVWLARCVTAICTGLTSYNAVGMSFSGQAAVGHTANAAIGGALGTMQEYVTQARASQRSRNTPYAVFAYGAYDSDPVTSGTLGMTVDLPFSIVAGVAASANHVTTEMVYDGNAKMNGGSLGAFIAQMPDTGLQWLAGVSGMTLKGDIKRGYLNGVSPSYSTGSTDGSGYGFIARAGWAFSVLPQTQVTPFASYTSSVMHFNGYTEADGVFAAQFGSMRSRAETARLGADARYTFAPNAWMWSTLAWGHRLDDGKGADITGVLIDTLSMTVPGVAIGRDWLEVGGGVRVPTWTNGAVTASLTASVPADGVTTYLARVGLTQVF